jgi:hypothetical protein
VYSLKPAFSAVSIPFWLLSIWSELRFLENGIFSKFEFPAHASGADETLVSFGVRSNRRRHSVALSGGILLPVWRHNTAAGGGIDCNQH